MVINLFKKLYRKLLMIAIFLRDGVTFNKIIQASSLNTHSISLSLSYNFVGSFKNAGTVFSCQSHILFTFYVNLYIDVKLYSPITTTCNTSMVLYECSWRAFGTVSEICAWFTYFIVHIFTWFKRTLIETKRINNYQHVISKVLHVNMNIY